MGVGRLGWLPANELILLVEDSDSDAALIERALRTAGVANPIQRVGNGTDALASLTMKERSNAAIDPAPLGILLLDLKLPDQSGFDILKIIQSRQFFSRVLKVVISSAGDMENIKRAYTLGADSFISKPVTLVDLRELISSFPDRWVLVDSATAKAPVPPEEPDPYKDAAHVWAANQQIIQVLRENLRVLHDQLADNEETFVIIQTLAEELRSELGLPHSNKLKKRSLNLF